MSVQNNGGTTGGITGRGFGFRPGRSGNPGGRPKGLAKSDPGAGRRGRDGIGRAVAQDPMRRDSDRLEASKLLADRGWGKAAVFEPLDGDPLDLADAEAAAEARILRLAEAGEQADSEGLMTQPLH